ncbi:MAG: hypothetical protein IT424_01225 [Pirellulales bacterium]|nr:hypothetical protein [Pirellulales bacterium]
MNATLQDFKSGMRLAEATAEQLNDVAGGFNYSLWTGSYGVIFFPTGTAYTNADGKSGGFLPKDGSPPITWKA